MHFVLKKVGHNILGFIAFLFIVLCGFGLIAGVLIFCLSYKTGVSPTEVINTVVEGVEGRSKVVEDETAFVENESGIPEFFTPIDSGVELIRGEKQYTQLRVNRRFEGEITYIDSSNPDGMIIVVEGEGKQVVPGGASGNIIKIKVQLPKEAVVIPFYKCWQQQFSYSLPDSDEVVFGGIRKTESLAVGDNVGIGWWKTTENGELEVCKYVELIDWGLDEE